MISNLNDEATQNQINELKKKLEPIQQMIISLRPKKKYSMKDYIPNFDYDNDVNTNDDDNQSPLQTIDTYENDNQEPFSDRLYKQLDDEEETTGIYIHIKFVSIINIVF
jgi:hypothetical protein